jgi:hypothetical protein
MRAIKFIFVIAFCFAVSCKNQSSGVSCQYSLNQLLAIDTPKLVSKIVQDTIIEISDKTKDSLNFGKGVYTFDRKYHLRFYGFFDDEVHCKYSEEFDSVGNLIKVVGSPLLEYRLWKIRGDSLLFNVSLFALDKKYDELEIVTNRGDTIRPTGLWKSNIYSNVKCFAFKIKSKGDIADLVCSASGIVSNTCSQAKQGFKDTAEFRDIKL